MDEVTALAHHKLQQCDLEAPPMEAIKQLKARCCKMFDWPLENSEEIIMRDMGTDTVIPSESDEKTLQQMKFVSFGVVEVERLDQTVAV